VRAFPPQTPPENGIGSAENKKKARPWGPAPHPALAVGQEPVCKGADRLRLSVWGQRLMSRDFRGISSTAIETAVSGIPRFP